MLPKEAKTNPGQTPLSRITLQSIFSFAHWLDGCIVRSLLGQAGGGKRYEERGTVSNRTRTVGSLCMGML